jgi:hypothetical protein
MTSLLSDMRMVSPQGLTFRITQPNGLRACIWGQLKVNVRGGQILSRYLHATIQDSAVGIFYMKHIVIYQFVEIFGSLRLLL